VAENADGTLTPAPESVADSLRRVADKRNDDKLRQAQETLAQLVMTDPAAAENKVQYIASLIIALRKNRGPRS
jgi:hypothetical protein